MQNDDYTEATEAEKPVTYWSIDLGWFPRNNRSFSAIATDYLCPDCRKRLDLASAQTADAKLLTAISGCCARAPGFISRGSPLRENIFRLFLAEGNQNLDPEQLAQKLNERCGGRPTSPDTLHRLLASDNFYGLCQVEVSAD